MASKINKKNAGILLGALICLLVFVSKTVYYYKLPEVTAVKPFRGILNRVEKSSGFTFWAKTHTTCARLSGAVAAIYVNEGEAIQAGQPLFAMDYDTDGVERKLRELQNNMKKLEKDLHYIAAKLKSINRALEAASGGETPHTGEYRSGLVSIDLHKARLILQEAEFAYEQGAKSRNDLEAARDTMAALYLKYESDQEALRFELETKNMDLQNLQLQEELYRNTLRDHQDYAVITAAAAGTVVSIYISPGMYVPEKTAMLSMGMGNEFALDCIVSPENNFILPGDPCELSNAVHTLQGTVSAIKPSAQGKTIRVTLASGGLSPGETFEVNFQKESAITYTLVPNAALNQDADGYFLNQIKRRKGILGEEYYAERLNVYIGDSDLTNTAIIRGIVFFDPLLLRSNKTVISGDAVSLTNPEDFFAY